jgi:hypothetical protein
MVNPGLAHWRDAVERRLTLEDFGLMIAQPRFEEAARLFFAQSLSRRARFPLFSRVLKDTRRALYGFMVLYLHARDGITLARIRQICEEMNLASPGRAAAILVHMRMIGFVQPAPNQPNKREKRYLPTSELEGAIHAIIRDDLHALSLVEPDVARAEQRLADPEFFRHFVLRAAEGLFTMRHTLIGTTFFAERDAGLGILYEVVLSAEPGDAFPPKGPVRMSIKDLARRHGVSRAHVFRLFRDAEKLGLLARDPDSQTGTIGDETRTALTMMAATMFIGYATCCEHAFRATSDKDTAAAS